MVLILQLYSLGCVVLLFSAASAAVGAECKYYQELNTRDRSMSVPLGALLKCDQTDIPTKGWYRFSGQAGDAMANKCPAINHCGTHAPGWMEGFHPTQAQGIVTRKVCYHWLGQCCKWNNNIRVRNCGGFYVYELVRTPECHLRYCGNGAIVVNHCAKNPCKNGAKCVSYNSGYVCQCPADFTGKNCEQVLVKSDPCKTYKRIDNPFRSTKYKLVQGDNAVCDSNLPKDWYRFTSDVGGMMPETKPDQKHCGTVEAVWINDTHPNNTGDVKNVKTCTNLDNAGSGCGKSHPIFVKHCGDYFVYQLRPTDGCPMGYCAGDKVPCPKGQAGIFPNCTVLQQIPHNLLPRPTLNWMDKQVSFAMVCQFDTFPCWKNVSAAVEWFADGHSVKNETIDNLETNCQSRRGELLATTSVKAEFKAGQRLRCRIRMKYNTHPNNTWTASYKESDDYYVGIKVTPSHVFVKECPPAETSFTVEVNLRPTVPVKPIGPWDPEPTWRINIPKHLLKLVFSHCTFKLTTDDIKTGKNITIAAACSNVNNPQNKEVLDYEFKQVNIHPLWYDYKSPVRVTIDNANKKMCQAVSDPHYLTFDSQYFDFYEHGDYVLYSNPERNFEIHTRLWVCWGVACNCGLAIREGNDVIVISACNSELHYRSEPTILRTKVRSKGRLARGTHIYRSPNGFVTEVILPSGARIRVERSQPWLTVYLYAPVDDHGKTGGLCGNANGQGDDFWNGGKSGNVDGSALSFARSWKLPPNKSYFDILPKKVKVKSTFNSWCDCRDNEQCTDNTVRRTDLDIVGKNDMTNEINTAQHQRKRSITDYVYSDEYVMNNVEKSFFINKDDVESTVNHMREKRAVFSGRMSKDNATAYCKGIIEESKAGKTCKEVPGFNLTNALLSCIQDLEITGDTELAGGAFNSMKQGCEEAALSNITLYKQDASGVPQPPKEIQENLCSNDCSNHGNCTNGTCICDEGYTSDDCSMSVNALPEILGIYDGGLCDVRQRPCKKIDLFGENFLNSNNLTCHIKEFKVVSSSWVPKSHILKLPGQMIDVFGVRCQLPDPPTKIRDYDSDGTPAGGLWISISNDGEHRSHREMRFISYDSLCIVCNKTGNCTLKGKTCLIGGHCFAPNEWNPQDWCQQCIPDKSQNVWTKRKGNTAPSFEQGQSTLYAIVGEDLSLQLKAKDPDKRPVTYSLISSTASSGYNFSSTGLLQWNVTSQEDFAVKVTDECNATDIITITVHIVVCPCKNGGQCFPHPNSPRGSGEYSCQCPKGFSGGKCETNIDDCASVNCGNGTCIDGINNFTCRCDAGFTGSFCNQRILNCTDQACFTGVQCTETASGITCGPCPIGTSGDGKTCSEQTTQQKTTSKTTVPTTPTTQDIRGYIVKAELSIKMKWDDVYLKQESQEFHLLARIVENDILNSYKSSGNGNLTNVRVFSMREGSIIVEFELVFNSKQIDPLQPLKKSIENGKMGTFTVDPNSLKIISEATDEPHHPEKVDLTLILVLVGLGIVIFVAVVLVFKIKKPLKRETYRVRKGVRSSQSDENGEEILEMQASSGGSIQKKRAAKDIESSTNAGFHE